jgi:8-oxo-dGTP pyrophosphatase MutT (NUDIX family)
VDKEEFGLEKWKVLSTEYIVENPPYHRMRRDRCLLPNGEQIDYCVNEYPDWVNAVVLTPERNLVLVRQYRHGLGDFMLELPAGMIDPGESSESAITREIGEETGHRSDQAPILLGRFLPNPGNASNVLSIYLMLGAKHVEDQHLDKTEDIEVVVVPFEAFGHMVQLGQVPQMFSAMGYFLAKNYLVHHVSPA